MSASNKRKLSSGKWMWALGAQRKRALEVGRVTSPGSYRALSMKPQGRRTGKGTGLPSHCIASHLFIEKDQNLRNNLTLPSAPCPTPLPTPAPTALGATGVPTACNKAPPTQTCSSLFVARVEGSRCQGFCPSAPGSRRRGWKEEQVLGEE